jgi:hypothetical protein
MIQYDSHLNLQASTSLPSIDTVLERAGSWFLQSGIQEETGGVARYYLSDSQQNAPVSAEITGYFLSTLAYLTTVTGERRYLDAAERAGQYLIHHAWNEHSATFPFEPVQNGGPAYAYFFDCGIIARGLLAMWRATGNQEYFERAKECGLSMAFDFMAKEAMHPILRLPDKQPVAYDRQWSRRPGCYQLKSAMAWQELAVATGQRELASAFERMVSYSLTTHNDFLPGHSQDEKVMDRLHAYAYFLEALLVLPEHDRAATAMATGIERMAMHLRRIAPEFVRCDVYAQLLRLRLFADRLSLCELDKTAAGYEASRIAEFQANGSDPRTSGGFWFGRKQDQRMPFVNPVSTAFAIQALAMWREYQDGAVETPVLSLI